mgnify:CR=1 FL=1
MRTSIPWRDCLEKSWHRSYPAAKTSGRIIWRDLVFSGKFIYLMDAYEDVEQDIKKGTYNPLKKRYEEPGFEEECRQILTMMMSECCKEFEQLPILQNVDILRNILYSGVWCRYEIVREKREKDSVNEVTGNDL